MAYYRCGGGVPSSVKTLPTYKTASGSVATFETDMTENLISCVCDIPDTGASAVNVSQCGVNIYNSSTRINGYYISATGVITPEANSCYAYVKVSVGETYTFSGRAYGTGNKRVHAYDKDKNWLQQLDFTPMSGTGDYSVTVTIPSGCYYVGLSYAQADAYLMLVNGSSVLPYEAYSATTATCSFGQTVYGGTVDVVTGKIIDGSDVVAYASNTLEIPTLNGTNNLFTDVDSVTAKYILSVGEALRQS